MEIILKDVRIAFPALFEAKTFKESSAYGAKFFVPVGSANYDLINKTIAEVIRNKWPKKADVMFEEFRMDKKAFPWIDGKRVEYAGAEGNWVLTARRREQDGRPMVIDQRKHPLTAGDGKPYSGCYVNVKVDLWAQDGDNKGVRCTLVTVQFARDGESFGGSKPATDDGFDDLGDTGGDADDLM